MKKILIASAILALFGTAQAAEPTVAVSGSIAVSMQNTVAVKGNKMDLSDADINFSASEDLGGGVSVKASTSISNEAMRGNGVTVNNTSLSLGGGFGSISYSNVLSGAAKLSAGVSAEDDMSDFMGGNSTVNILTITSPTIAGFNVGIEYSGDDASALEVSGTPNVFANGALGPVSVYAETGGAGKVWDVRASVDAGPAKVSARTTKEKMSEVAVTLPAGPVTVGVHYATKDNGDKATGAVASYALSKRTSLSANYVTGKGNSLDGNNYRVQLKHTF